PDVMKTALDLRLYDGVELAFGFEQPVPGTAGQGLDGFGPFNPATVHAMVEFDDDGPGPDQSCLYVAGEFKMAGGVRVNNIARWNGAGWSALGNGVGNGVSSGYNGAVLALAVYD